MHIHAIAVETVLAGDVLPVKNGEYDVPMMRMPPTGLDSSRRAVEFSGCTHQKAAPIWFPCEIKR